MNAQFYCRNKDRIKKVSESNSINGIDYLEISLEDQKLIKLFFLHNLYDPRSGRSGRKPIITNDNFKLTKDNIFIDGGVRIKNIVVKEVFPDPSLPNVLVVVVDKTGDYSTYTLKVRHSRTDPDLPPPGFDVQLSSIDFSFKVNCPGDFDCKNSNNSYIDSSESEVAGYLAKDFSSFNRLMLDRLSIISPDWKERNAADLQIALIELMAYLGDYLSYYQDAVATEAYLETARRRSSLRRHARLLDYLVHDGCNARVWIQIEVEAGSGADGKSVDTGTMLMTNGLNGKASILVSESTGFIAERNPVVFETMHRINLNSAHNLISFYTWENSDCCLPMGSTRATLLNEPLLSLSNGDVLIFEELYSPVTGRKADRNPEHRQAVRLKKVESGLVDELTGRNIMNIEWYESDALAFPLCITNSVSNEDMFIPVNEKSIARGNIVLADQGLTKKDKKLVPPVATSEEEYNPKLPDNNITNAVPYNHAVEKNREAAIALLQDPHIAVPYVRLVDLKEQDIWSAKNDLLGSDRFANEFVVETEQDGTSYIRFGDNISGKRPSNGFEPTVSYRIGNGKDGIIGAEAIDTIVFKESGILKVRNPMAASGAMNAESMEEIRQYAPQAFRIQERAVTESDYASKTELHHDVQKAIARFRWTGSWYTVYIIIDRKGGRKIDSAFRQEIIMHLERYRMAGYDIEIVSPGLVPLLISMNVCVKQGYFRSTVKQNLFNVFSNYDLPDGTKGFFHPDNFTFGQQVYLSAIYSKAMNCNGVASVEIVEFQRWGKIADNEIENGLIKPSESEIICLDNDPNFPENGRIDFKMYGGW